MRKFCSIMLYAGSRMKLKRKLNTHHLTEKKTFIFRITFLNLNLIYLIQSKDAHHFKTIISLKKYLTSSSSL